MTLDKAENIGNELSSMFIWNYKAEYCKQKNDLVLEEVGFEVKVVGRNIFMWFDHIERIQDARLTN